MSKYEKVFIYFDTNILEPKFGKDSLNLSQFTVKSIYYEIKNLIEKAGINDKVELCIPEIVWMELKEHYIRCFKSEKQSLTDVIEPYKKIFGELLELSYKIKHGDTLQEYKEHLDDMSSEFLENPRNDIKIVPYPKDEEIFDEIVKKAVRTNRPFKKFTISQKEYTDAGFKDALIYNTIVNCTGKHLGILVTGDKDFIDLFNNEPVENLKLCTNLEEVKEVLASEFDIITDKTIEDILNSDEYLIHKILSDSGLDENATYHIQKVNIKETTEEGTRADFMALVNGELYSFEVLYNIPANELIESACEPYEEREE